MDFAISLPEEICAELGARARARRILMNVSVDELAHRIGVSAQTLSNFERTGKCTLVTFMRILESLNAAPDLQQVLAGQTRSIEEMRAKSMVSTRQRAYRRSRSAK
jgi:transcriptional regulator with XRE-family HTH domain